MSPERMACLAMYTHSWGDIERAKAEDTSTPGGLLDLLLWTYYWREEAKKHSMLVQRKIKDAVMW